MIGRRRLGGLGAAFALAELAGCASPTPEFFTLVAVPGVVLPTTQESIELRRIGLAAYLDRPGIVRANARYQVKIGDNERWAEPLGSMIQRVFIEDLVRRLPDAMIFSEAGAISTRPNTVLEIDIERFDPDADATVVLLAQVAIRAEGSDKAATARTIRLVAQPAGPSTAELAAALSAVLGRFADQIAGLLARR